MTECRHGEPRGWDGCALCRRASWSAGPSWSRPAAPGRDVPMPDWFRAMLDQWRDGGPLSVPRDKVSGTDHRKADDDRPRYA